MLGHQDGALGHSVKCAFPLDGMPPLTPPLPHRNGATPHPLPRISPAIGVTPPPPQKNGMHDEGIIMCNLLCRGRVDGFFQGNTQRK